MSAKKAKPADDKESSRPIAENRKAFHDYHILETFEAGIALLGTEVKGIREGQANLRDSFARVDKGEVWLFNVHINPYSHRGYVDHDPKRKRRLLLHKYEIRKLIGKTVEKGLTLVPTRMYFKNGKVKVAIALAKGKQDHDKRETLRRREIDRETRAAVKERVPPMRAAEGADGADRMRVLVVGAAGQLGRAMLVRLEGEHDVTGWTRQDIDLTRHRDVREAIAELAPEAIVNCASYNQVDAAQEQQTTALEVNAMIVGTLARAAAAVDAVLVHYSTDFVFAGTATTPYTEADLPEPRSVYAQSKLIGEWLAADAPRHYVLRVESLFGGPQRKSSVDRIVDAVRSGQTAPVFADRVVSPSFVVDVCDATAFVLQAAPPKGLYHCVNSGHATWLAVGQEIVRHLGGSSASLKPISVNDVSLPAPRPQFAALSNEKLARAGYVMPTWQDAIRRYLVSCT